MARTDPAHRVLDERYELIAPVGEGTFGRVYRARDLLLDREVAVKVIKPWWAEDPVWVERFAREARTLAHVSHPGIVQIYDVGRSADSPYYVAELVEGESLAQRLRSGPLAPAQAADVALQLCRALAHAHERHVVHRDVKPANILLTPDGRVKVGDFGVARLADGSTGGAAATAIGTPRYMSPEQARGGHISPASDVYGVGVVLYEMLAGRPPFRGESGIEVAVRHLNDPPPPLPRTVPPQLAAVVERALAKRPHERFADGGAMAAALAAIPAAALAGPAHALDTPVTAPGGDDAATSHAPTRAGAPAAARTLAAPRPQAPPALPRRARLLVPLLLVAAGAALAILLIPGAGRTRVPDLRGLTRAAAERRARRDHVRLAFSGRFAASAPRGTVIAQQPDPGAQVDRGIKVAAVLSTGPPPVTVPYLVGQSAASAESALAAAGLRAHVTLVPAPGEQAGTVIRQSPVSSTSAARGSTVELTVVQAPRWRAVTSFASTGGGDGRSVPFRIRGKRWRVSYDMQYDGTCTFLLVCFGPSADVVRPAGGGKVDSFDLGDGSGKTHQLDTGPGIFQITVGAGQDSAHWSMTVQDYY